MNPSAHNAFAAAVAAAVAATPTAPRVAMARGFADAAERIGAAGGHTACVWASGRVPAPGAPGTMGAARMAVTVAIAAQGAISPAAKAGSAHDALSIVKEIETSVLATVPGAMYQGATNQPATNGAADFWVITFEKVG